MWNLKIFLCQICRGNNVTQSKDEVCRFYFVNFSGFMFPPIGRQVRGKNSDLKIFRHQISKALKNFFMIRHTASLFLCNQTF